MMYTYSHLNPNFQLTLSLGIWEFGRFGKTQGMVFSFHYDYLSFSFHQGATYDGYH